MVDSSLLLRSTRAPQRERGDDTRAPSKRKYSPPSIELQISISSLVLSPSPGTFESGPGGGYKSGNRSSRAE